jgi:hypothetical protein
VFASFACVAAFYGAEAASPVTMTATTPFTESKATDASGAVSYRVGGVFAAAGNGATRLSLTVVCSPGGGPLGLLIVRTNAPAALKSGMTTVTAHVDGIGMAPMNADRITGNGLASYDVKPAGAVESFVSAMMPGQKLLVDVEEFSAEIPLAGFAAEMKDLTAACPHH